MSNSVSSSPKSAVLVSPGKNAEISHGITTESLAAAPSPTVDTKNNIINNSNNNNNSLSVRSRVERLSICEGTETKDEILSKLHPPSSSSSRDSVSFTDGKEDDEITDINNTQSGSKRRRRRSSAVQSSSSLDNLKRDNLSTSSLAVPKKKKKSTKSVNIVLEKLSKPLSIKDLRDLVLFAFRDTNNAPSWLQIDNRSALQKIIVLFVPGLLPEDFSKDAEHKEKLTSFADNLETLTGSHTLPPTLFSNPEAQWYNLPLCAPGSKNSLFSAYNSFVNVGLNKKEKEKKRAQLSKKKVVMDDLLMTVDNLIENDYPIHLETPGLSDEFKETLQENYSKPEYKDWVNTTSFEHEAPHTFAIDCEMCLSDNGPVLTRCSVVDFNEKLIYDKLVKPDVPIIDYLTRYSGITEEKLRDVTTTLKDVQEDLLKIISTDDVLIGHSLQSDLNVLKVRHTRIVDTAIIYEHKAGPPFKPGLKYLASEHLNIDIQKDTGLGHDSYEDAKTCLELTKLKIQNGLAFGLGINTENLFHRLSRSGVSSMILNDSASRQSKVLKSDSSNELHVRCKDDQMIVDEICEHIEEHNFFVGRLRELEFARQFATCNNPDTKIAESPEIAIHNLKERFTKIYEHLPPSSMLLVCSGTGDTREWIKIMGELNKLDKDVRFSEKAKREEEIQQSVKTARDAISFMTVKAMKPKQLQSPLQPPQQQPSNENGIN